jgi:hypothetical protein
MIVILSPALIFASEVVRRISGIGKFRLSIIIAVTRYITIATIKKRIILL